MKRPWLLPFVPLYAAGEAWKRSAWNRHPERAKRLHDPVISVGSLSAGGAGKTPFVIALGEALRRAGYGVDVLSRGHGRTTQESLRVDPHPVDERGVERFGDEPVLIARRLMCPVYVGRERYDAGRMAEQDRRVIRGDRSLSLHLLDDGFQHRRLARAFDIVLLTAEDARDSLLPAGNLREPLRALERADAIVLRHDEKGMLQPVLAQVFKKREMPHLWSVERRFLITEGAPGQRPLAFCGIARPEGFAASLGERGITPVALLPFRDHTAYTDEIIKNLIGRAKDKSADSFITTAKDAVKLTREHRRALASVGPLSVADIVVSLRDEQSCVEQIIAKVRADWSRG